METPKRNVTPQRQGSAKRNLVLSPNLTPVEVSSGRSPSQGNLTGSARKVKDGTADWYNSVQKWNNYNRQGLALIKLICNMKLEFSYAENEADDSTQDSPGWSPKLQEICEKLTSVLNSMRKILEKFQAVTLMMKNVGDLELHTNNGEWEEEPLFQTWPTWKFYKTSKELLEMYEKELEVKTTIVENVAHTPDRDLSMVYTATWLHEPYIHANKDLLLQAMCTECRLR